MEFVEFKNMIIEKLIDYYGSDTEVSINEVIKTNDVFHTGVTVKLDNIEGSIAPTVYIDEMYECFERGEIDMDDVMDNIIKTVESAKPNISFELDKLSDWDYVKAYIYPVIVNAENNTKMLENLVVTDYLDLSVLYAIRVMEDSYGIGSIKLNKDLFEKYDISQEELYQQAVCNLRAAGYITQSMTDMMKGMMDEDEYEAMIGSLDNSSEELYVVTTKNKINGASSILDFEYFKEKFGERDAYIIPSSLHELLVLPSSAGMSLNYINDMIEEVNMTCLQESEILSDHAYFYDGRNNTIRCA